ncbi:MAG: bifunctional chorismate mutase/prephenate dehydratase [Cellulosilyticum sp.]|nr:bifunctional chorismate mutase/prephenate dehydratase [Cellulosilyticum sp.]
MESEVNYTGITRSLNISIDNLYEHNQHILCQIEEGINAQTISSPVVGYQGVPGANGEEATYTYFKGKWSQIIAHESFEDVIEALLEGKIDYGVLPIENSSTGEVLDTYDLIKNNELYIVGEQSIKIENNLLVVPGSKIEDIEEVYSHPQALGQSKEFLKNHPKIKPLPYINTATACKHVADLKDKTKAAIGNRRAGVLYELENLVPNINFNKNNFTRFIVLANKMNITQECNKISIVFSTEHLSGALYNILGHFAHNGLNLLKIQSRPLLEKKWQYYFFADLEGNLEQANVLIALSQIMNQCSYFKILGNYKQCE